MKSFLLLLLLITTCICANAQSAGTDSIYTSENLDRGADFEGGNQGWMMYLMRNLTYPLAAQNRQITGTVVVQFVVDKKGKVSEVMAISGPEMLQKEGIRLIKHSPRWIPAMKDGEKVRSYKTQQIIFKLAG